MAFTPTGPHAERRTGEDRRHEDRRHPMTGNRMDPGASSGIERHEYDVVVIGAGGAGLRAAIAAHDAEINP